jgi:hypothetical protein
MTKIMAATASAPSTLSANINYFLELDQGGTVTVYPGTAIDKLRLLNSTYMPITDMRDCEQVFDLDVHGFAFVSHKSVESNYDDKERIVSVVYHETEDLLKEV